MKSKVKITSSEQYNELLDSFKKALLSKLPYNENASLVFKQDPTMNVMFGNAAVVAELETNSSRCDKYLITLNQNNEAEFVRLIGNGDKL